MANPYSDLFSPVTSNAILANVLTTTTGYTARSAVPTRKGESITIRGSYTNTTTAPIDATNSKLYLAGPFPAGVKPLRFKVIPSADMDTDNDFTFNAGFTSAPTGFASASTALQATTGAELDLSDLYAAAASTSGDYLELNRAAGELEAAGTIHFEFECIVP